MALVEKFGLFVPAGAFQEETVRVDAVLGLLRVARDALGEHDLVEHHVVDRDRIAPREVLLRPRRKRVRKKETADPENRWGYRFQPLVEKFDACQ